MKTSSAETRRKKLWSRILFWAGVIYLGVLVALVLVEWFVAERYWLSTLITYMPQHPFGVPPILFMLVSLAMRYYKIAALNGIAIVFFALTLHGFNVPVGSFTAKTTGEPLRVMTYNIHHSQEGAIRVAEVVDQLSPDVICLQEADPVLHWSNTVNELARLLPDWDYAVHGELATFSRHRILYRGAEWISPATGRVILRTEIEVAGRRVTVLNTHFPTTLAGGESLRHRTRPIRLYMEDAAAIRAETAAKLYQVADRVQGPLLVAGDFNTPPRGLIYRGLARRFTDTFSSTAWGTGFTYRSSLPVLRIDYVFAGPGFKPVSCRAVSAEASDHKPVVADLVLTGR